MAPILYSFRRCPYAIRARMALAYAQISVEHREVVLRHKPAAMLAASPKGTVPVLVLSDGRVIDESLGVMHWALEQHDPDHWLATGEEAEKLIDLFDTEFKPILDRYKYWDRYPEFSQQDYLEQAMPYLRQLDDRLQKDEYLFGRNPGLADVALFPFIRQFVFSDKATFDKLPCTTLSAWLNRWLESPLFLNVMQKFDAWRE